MFELLKKVLSPVGPSGLEAPVAEVIREEIAAYVDSDEPYDKAGAYGIQVRGGLFVEKISGDYTNVVGLPIAVLNKELRKF